MMDISAEQIFNKRFEIAIKFSLDLHDTPVTLQVRYTPDKIILNGYCITIGVHRISEGILKDIPLRGLAYKYKIKEDKQPCETYIAFRKQTDMKILKNADLIDFNKEIIGFTLNKANEIMEVYYFTDKSKKEECRFNLLTSVKTYYKRCLIKSLQGRERQVIADILNTNSEIKMSGFCMISKKEGYSDLYLGVSNL